jgi:uncharacterized protein (DUF362 family)/Pyruvate/2-oxoacid:ferredoxin oxidoreductase delta subunit
MDRAVAEAIELAGGFDCRGASVLVKPNLLNASSPDRAVTTNPELLRAFLRALKRGGATRLLVGDSPGWQSQETVGLRTGAKDAALSEGAEWAEFAEGAEVENPEGRLVKRFNLAAALGEVDLLVSLPKLKTHQLMYYTGAIKNLFGLVPGIQKSAFHLRFPGRADFAAMLADLALAAKPDFALMDAVMAMEGPGPNSGRPKRLGLLLASRDALALDLTAAELIGYDPLAIPYLAALLGRGAFVASPSEIELRGANFEAARPASFELVPLLGETDFFKRFMPKGLHRLVRDLTVAHPRFDHKACVRCGGCVKICPAGALEIRPHPAGGRRVEIDLDSCIRCYCCHEVCPEDAISLAKGPF